MSEGLHELAKWSLDPWEGQRASIDWVEQALKIELADKSADEICKFKPRVDAGWYLRELKIFADMADQHVREGNASWAAHAAVHFGALYSEFQLKLAREDLYCKALETRGRQATAKPKPSAALRVERWRHYRVLGHGKTNSDLLAAQDLGDGESTVRGARLGWEKAAAASD
jgi:hypothetical protein